MNWHLQQKSMPFHSILSQGLCKNVWRPFAASLARQLKVDLKLQSNRRQEAPAFAFVLKGRTVAFLQVLF